MLSSIKASGSEGVSIEYETIHPMQILRSDIPMESVWR